VNTENAVPEAWSLDQLIIDARLGVLVGPGYDKAHRSPSTSGESYSGNLADDTVLVGDLTAPLDDSYDYAAHGFLNQISGMVERTGTNESETSHLPLAWERPYHEGANDRRVAISIATPGESLVRLLDELAQKFGRGIHAMDIDNDKVLSRADYTGGARFLLLRAPGDRHGKWSPKTALEIIDAINSGVCPFVAHTTLNKNLIYVLPRPIWVPENSEVIYRHAPDGPMFPIVLESHPAQEYINTENIPVDRTHYYAPGDTVAGYLHHSTGKLPGNGWWYYTTTFGEAHGASSTEGFDTREDARHALLANVTRSSLGCPPRLWQELRNTVYDGGAELAHDSTYRNRLQRTLIALGLAVPTAVGRSRLLPTHLGVSVSRRFPRP